MLSSFATSSTFDFDAGFPASYAPLSSAATLEESSFAHGLSQEKRSLDSHSGVSAAASAKTMFAASAASSSASSSSPTSKAMDLTADAPAGEPGFGDLWSCVSSSDLDRELASSPASPADSAVQFDYPDYFSPDNSDFSPSPDLTDSDMSPFADSPALSELDDWSDGSSLQHCLSDSGVDSRLFPNGFDPHMSFDSALASGQYPLSSLPCHESVMSPKARAEAELASALELAPAFELSAAPAAASSSPTSPSSLQFAASAGTTGGKVKPKLKLKLKPKAPMPAPIKLPASAQPKKKTVVVAATGKAQLSTANKKKAAAVAPQTHSEVTEVKMTARQMSREQRLIAQATAAPAASLPDTKELLAMMAAPVNPEDNEISIGTYTRAERKAKIRRYMEKRARRLARIKKGGYECRSRYAVARPRIGGRFISLKGEAGQAALAEWRRLNADAVQDDMEDDEEEISEATMALE